MSLASKEMLDVMWRLAAVGTDVETSVLLYSALIGVYNIRILTVRGWRVPSCLTDNRKATLQAIHTDAVNKAVKDQKKNIVLDDLPQPINNSGKKS